jgi:hypothetical protein
MTISAKIIADSISYHQGIRLTTMQLRYPRFIHAEFMTHRVFSRNASSSRAIPVERLIEDVIRDTAMPLHWGKNQPGMQAREEHNALIRIDGLDIRNGDPAHCNATAPEAWNMARDKAISIARAFNAAGYHKQIVNRLLEPFSHINVLVTATEYDNFFALRDHPDAQPEIRVLAQEMRTAMMNSTVKVLHPGQWHLPYVTPQDWETIWSIVGRETVGDGKATELALKLSVPRCASLSYKTVDGQDMTPERATKLYDQLLSAVPLHASPAEHQATPDTGAVCYDASKGPSARKPFFQWDNPHKHGNLKGWIQFRKTLAGENQAANLKL